MNKNLYKALFFLILTLAFLIRVIPPMENNFYFTMDQGNDAVFVREIWQHGEILLKGPETGMADIFTGPGWYYFIAVGYKIFGGHPYGALFMVILLSVGSTAYLMWQISARASKRVALFVGLALQVYWYYYDTSRWAFNPFPLVFLSFWLIFLLIGFWEGKRRSFIFGLIPIGLAFNTEVAGTLALFLFHTSVGILAVVRKKLSPKVLVLTNFVLPAALLSPFLLSLYKELGKSSLISGAEVGRGFFSGTNFVFVFQRFEEIFTRSIIPQSLLLSLLVFAAVVILFVKSSTKNVYVNRFVSLVLFLFSISYFLFSTNKGWREWHTIYLYPLLFISFLLMAVALPKKFSGVILGIVLISQFILFQDRYTQYLKPTDDYSILSQEMKVLDWIYSKNEGNGFNVYVYSPHVYDYNWQYLFWWYGRERYGFVPCEYTIQPGFLKDTYVPSSAYYTKPQLGCDKFSFLIIEPVGDRSKYDVWYAKATGGTELAEDVVVGNVRLEKRVKKQ